MSTLCNIYDVNRGTSQSFAEIAHDRKSRRALRPVPVKRSTD